jgi:putative ABC transport system permease protein
MYRAAGEGEPDDFQRASFRLVSESYHEAMGIPLLRGRFFEHHDVVDRPRVALINQKLSNERWPGADPLGKRLAIRGYGDADYEVVGVVGDVHQRGLTQESEPTIYIPRLPSPAASFVVRTALEPSRVVDQLKKQTAEVDPHLPLFAVSTLQDSLDGSLARERFQSTLMTSFTAVALTLAIVGVYSVMAYSVAHRRHEIGVRMAMGARGTDVMRMILRQASVPTLLGAALGLVSAFALTGFFESLLFGVSPRDPTVFISAALVLVLVAFIAAWAPARHAARVDPQEVLREQ